ncbi:SWIB-domain-containing protein [Gonapodya prolifera JEL478]|uniref:SWIB-domain-containing protein n=1 Tax=Gonapodya prolifera (strain JEL478) TaxID=1344416 RepID=A0A139A9X9_GONPJ|nr:SWIB-domain-containing protein [Gonapodya prolifera JEL478]|eukprot:KXS13464.1 SWIB-domain-containing protein [Gonapodya prolifera JEL478]
MEASAALPTGISPNPAESLPNDGTSGDGTSAAYSEPAPLPLDHFSPREILKTANLNEVSAKKVRRQIEEEFKVDLSTRKQEFDTFLLQLLEEVAPPESAQEGEDGSQQEERTNGKRRKKRETTPQSDASSKFRSKGKKSNLSSDVVMDDDDEDGGDKEETDEQLARRLQREESGTRSRRSTTSATTYAGRKRGGASLTGEPKKARKSPFNRPKELSPELAAVVGESVMSRPQVVKKLWEYIKARDLQDPSNKRRVLLEKDEVLGRVFPGRKWVDAFGMNKTLSKHIWDVADEQVKESDDDADDDVDDGSDNSDNSDK